LIVYGPALLWSLFPVVNSDPLATLSAAPTLTAAPTETIAQLAATATPPENTPTLPTPTLVRPSPTLTRVVVPLTCGTLEDPLCSLEQAEALAGFKVFVPSDLPEGLSFLGAIATPGDSSTQAYSCGEECYLTIHQQILEQTQDWLDSRNHRGEFIPVGSHFGFYYSNNFARGNGLPTQPGNAASANQVLQWTDFIDHIQFGLRISVYGSAPENSHLDRDDLTKLAHDTRGVPIPPV